MRFKRPKGHPRGILSAAVAAMPLLVPAEVRADYYVAGDFNSWNATGQVMTTNADGTVTATISGLTPGGRHEFKVTDGSWDAGHNWPNANSWFVADTSGKATIRFNPSGVADNWGPAQHRIGVVGDPVTTWTAVGDWQGWDNANAATAMSGVGGVGGGTYLHRGIVAAAGSHEYKAVKTGSWDGVGTDSRSINALSYLFNTAAANQKVHFWLNASNGSLDLANAITWSGAAGTAWGTGGNWTGGVVPTANDDAVFDAAVEVTLSGTRQVNALIFDDDAILSGGTIHVAGGAVVVAAGKAAVIDSTFSHLNFQKLGAGALAIGGDFSTSNGNGGALRAGTLEVGGGSFIGNAGFGSFAQTGGAQTIAGNLNVAYAAGASGRYELGAGALNVLGDALIGRQGAGAFAQTGGVHTIGTTAAPRDLNLGYHAGSTGTYTLDGSSASLVVNGNAYLGGDFNPNVAGGSGILNVNAGTATVTGVLRVWATAGTQLNLAGGTLSVGQLRADFNLNAFNWTGGTLVLGSSYVIDEYAMSGGTSWLGGSRTIDAARSISTSLNAYIGLGSHSTALLLQTGGSNTIAGTLSIGRGLGETSHEYKLQGGALSAKITALGGSESPGIGTFTQSGGTHTAETVFLGSLADSSGSYSLSGTGVFNVQGNAFIGGDDSQPGGKGQLDISGGTMNVSGALKVWDSGDTQVNLSGGTLAVDSLDTDSNPSRFVGDGTTNGWTGGTLNITGAPLLVGPARPLGTVLAITPPRTLQASGIDIEPTGQLVLSGGTLATPSIGIAGAPFGGSNTAPGSQGALHAGPVNATYAGAVVLNGLGTNAGDATLNQIGVDAGGTLTLSGVVSSGAGGTWAKTGPGTLVLAGSGANTYTGLTRLLGGVLVIEKDGALGAAGSNVAVTGNTLQLANSQSTIAFRAPAASPGLNYATSEWIFANGTGNGSLGQVDNLGGDNTFAGSIAFNGPTAGGAVQGEIGVSAGSLTVHGGIYAGTAPSGARNIHKIGPGTLVLTGNSSTTTSAGNSAVLGSNSVINIDAGTIKLSGPTFAVGGVAWNVNAGTTLQSTGGAPHVLSGAVNNAATVVVSDGTLKLSGGGTHAGVFNVAPAATIEFGGGTHTLHNGFDSFAGGGTLAVSGGALNAPGLLVGTARIPTVHLTGGALNVTGFDAVGYNGVGSFDHSGGTHAANDLRVGYHATGTYALGAGATLNVNGTEWIGEGAAAGTFTQNGGAHAVGGALRIGSGSAGIFNLHGGTLSYGAGAFALVGDAAAGAFAHDGGTHNVNNLYVAYNAGAAGSSYQLGGAAQLLVAGDERVGFNASGSFTQTGGTHTVGGNLTVGENAAGVYTQSAGTFNVGNDANDRLYLGFNASGTLNLSAGASLTVTGQLNSGVFGSGSIVQTGGTLTVNGDEFVGSSGAGSYVQSGGSHTVAGTLSIAANSGSSGSYHLNDGGLAASTLASRGAFEWNGGTLTVAQLQLKDGGTMKLAAGANKTLKVSSLTVNAADESELDLTDNRLITASPLGSATQDGDTRTYSGISGLIQSGFVNGQGDWSGPGIVTSIEAALGGLTTLGSAVAGEVLPFESDTILWGGQTVSMTDTIVMYTHTGDANLDGSVDGGDYAFIDAYVGSSAGDAAYYKGDFNYDGYIDGGDYAYIDVTVGSTPIVASAPSPASLTAVPEPSAAALAGVAMLAVARRRRRIR